MRRATLTVGSSSETFCFARLLSYLNGKCIYSVALAAVTILEPSTFHLAI